MDLKQIKIRHQHSLILEIVDTRYLDGEDINRFRSVLHKFDRKID